MNKNKMPLEDQVCTLKQAKMFDELGVRLNSHFVWACMTRLPTDSNPLKFEIFDHGFLDGFWADGRAMVFNADTKGIYPAYSAAELWGFLDVILNSLTENNDYFPYLHSIAERMNRFFSPSTHTLARIIIDALELKIITPEQLIF